MGSLRRLSPAFGLGLAFRPRTPFGYHEGHVAHLLPMRSSLSDIRQAGGRHEGVLRSATRSSPRIGGRCVRCLLGENSTGRSACRNRPHRVAAMILYHPRPERWPQVSLRGFFVLVTLLGVSLGWLGVQI